MPLRVSFHESEEADGLVQTLQQAGFDAGMAKERFAGQDDGEEVVYVVHTDAPADEVEDLIVFAEAWLEVTDPMSGTSAVVDSAADLPTAPRRTKDP